MTPSDDILDTVVTLRMAAAAYGDNDIGSTCRSAADSIVDLYTSLERLQRVVEALDAEIALARSQGAYL